MTQIRIDTEHVRETGRRLVSVGDRIADIGQELRSAVRRLDTGAWDGRSRRRAEPLLDRVQPESARVAEGLDELGRKLLRVADVFEQEDSSTAKSLVGMPWVEFGLAAGTGATGLTAAEFLRDIYYAYLIDRYPDGVFTFDGQRIDLEDMTAEQLAAAYTLSHMEGSEEPVTLEQLETLEKAFQLDFGEGGVAEWLSGKSQDALWRSLAAIGLVWNVDRLTNPYELSGPDYEGFSLNQQFLVLATHYSPEDPATLSKFELGKEYIQSIQAGDVVSCYPALTPEKLEDLLGPAIVIGTTNFWELDIAPSHSQIGIGNGIVAEAVKEGVVASRAVDHFVTVIDKGGAVTVHDVPQMTVDQRVAAARIADEIVKEKYRYNYLGLIFGVPGGDRSRYCSELAYVSLKESGVDIDLGTDGTLEDAFYASVSPVLGAVPLARISPQELKRASVVGMPLVTKFEYVSPNSFPGAKEAGQAAIEDAAESVREAAKVAVEDAAESAREALNGALGKT